MYVFIPLDGLLTYQVTVIISGEDGHHTMMLNFAVQVEWLSYISLFQYQILGLSLTVCQRSALENPS